jgi:hypothetical protein
MGLWRASRLPGHPVPYDEGRIRRPLVAGAGWLAAAALATVIGVAGIQLVGESLTSTPGGVLSQKQVGEALAEQSTEPTPDATVTDDPTELPSEPAAPTPSRTPETTQPAPAATSQRTFAVRGGTAIAVCRGNLAELEFWSPNQGFGVDKAERGPAREVRVRFRGSGGRSELRISCSDGVPVADEREEDH